MVAVLFGIGTFLRQCNFLPRALAERGPHLLRRRDVLLRPGSYLVTVWTTKMRGRTSPPVTLFVTAAPALHAVQWLRCAALGSPGRPRDACLPSVSGSFHSSAAGRKDMILCFPEFFLHMLQITGEQGFQGNKDVKSLDLRDMILVRHLKGVGGAEEVVLRETAASRGACAALDPEER